MNVKLIAVGRDDKVSNFIENAQEMEGLIEQMMAQR